jgi:hypothetical protein
MRLFVENLFARFMRRAPRPVLDSLQLATNLRFASRPLRWQILRAAHNLQTIRESPQKHGPPIPADKARGRIRMHGWLVFGIHGRRQSLAPGHGRQPLRVPHERQSHTSAARLGHNTHINQLPSVAARMIGQQHTTHVNLLTLRNQP